MWVPPQQDLGTFFFCLRQSLDIRWYTTVLLFDLIFDLITGARMQYFGISLFLRPLQSQSQGEAVNYEVMKDHASEAVRLSLIHI